MLKMIVKFTVLGKKKNNSDGAYIVMYLIKFKDYSNVLDIIINIFIVLVEKN